MKLAKGKYTPRHEDIWSVSTVVLALLILTPLVVVLAGLARAGPEWSHISETVLWSYVGNTVLLVITVSILCVFMAVPAAWLLSAFEFPGRKWLEWAMVLPLAIPTYVNAFVYMHVKESALPMQIWIRTNWGIDAFLMSETFLRYGLLTLLLASVLYPYLYLSVRASFLVQRRGVIEAAQLLGRGPASVFFTVALPLARPAIIAGLSLIIMELINDYGAVNFFGVPTLTEGIFRTWFGLQDTPSAMRLAGIMMLVVLILLLLEKAQRGRARFSEHANDTTPLAHRRLRPLAATGAVLTCLPPFFLGFLYPVQRLIRWAWMSRETFADSGMWQRMGHSLMLSMGTAIVLTFMAVLVVYTLRLHASRRLETLGRLATLGYAAPGAVVAVGVMVTFGFLDRQFEFLKMPLHLSGTLFAIGFAYLVRFFAVPTHPIKAAMTRVCGSLDEASRLLGHSPAPTLFRINLPLIKGTLISATILVFVDILKELPLTMILRPVNFETLATLSFGLAKEGRIHECAVPSLVIILLAAIGLVALNRLIRNAIT
ncbi:MAG: iron ABC transporter permease [Verrucomicrobia bacterium]|nr:iron ABC transporter permease [Verrucomicrobiota bacterium]MCH8512149.1 iron ABC transporter permease [Kiritimatiellia bacterium]